MATLIYDGQIFPIEDPDAWRQHILEHLRSGKPTWMEVPYEDRDGKDTKSWVLLAPGTPVTIDVNDPAEMPELPDLSALRPPRFP
ncbi:hypothetical protein [Actinomycetospora soli]|uniref:hypothetical protein n=1 Tax=Actinomycetospora soli TaxID=2893887 RepID=UPI001E4C7836|nr:hypothetical protein [Actinomycetospora soli]MCD2191357.1 hypothetical protein [Actinomycetospora soli]